jgi:hypothetical protein
MVVNPGASPPDPHAFGGTGFFRCHVTLTLKPPTNIKPFHYPLPPPPSRSIDHRGASTIAEHRPSRSIDHRGASTIEEHRPSRSIDHRGASTIAEHRPSRSIDHRGASTIAEHRGRDSPGHFSPGGYFFSQMYNEKIIEDILPRHHADSACHVIIPREGLTWA